MSLAMQQLGNTGLEVSRIGLGLAALGRPGYINLGHAQDLAHDYVVEAMEGRTHRMLDLAYEQGVRYFDAARSYGRAELFLQSWLKGKDLPDVVIGSKWGYIYTAEWSVEAEQHEIKRHDLEVLNRQWDESNAFLPGLNLYQIHSASFESGVLENKEVLNRLAQLKAQGTAIGITLSGDNQANVLEAALLTRVDGVHLFDCVQATFNILEQSIGPTLAQAAEAGLGIIVKEALANGRLTTRNKKPAFAKTKKILDELAQQYETGIDALALAYILTKPWAHTVLSGAAVESHLQSNLSAAFLKLNEPTLLRLEELALDPVEYWSERKGMQWN